MAFAHVTLRTTLAFCLVFLCLVSVNIARHPVTVLWKPKINVQSPYKVIKNVSYTTKPGDWPYPLANHCGSVFLIIYAFQTLLLFMVPLTFWPRTLLKSSGFQLHRLPEDAVCLSTVLFRLPVVTALTLSILLWLLNSYAKIYITLATIDYNII